MAATSSPSELVPARIVSVSKETPRVVSLRLQAPKEYNWAAGQHLALRATSAAGAPSYYSIASAPRKSEPGILELAAAIESLPEGVRVEPGTEVWLGPPAGKLTVARLSGAASLVLIGMGTGVAPLRAIVQALEDEDGVSHVTLLQGARFENELLFRDEFIGYAARGMDYRPVLSRPDPAWTARTGWVQHHLGGLSPKANYRLCGSRAMVTEVTARLVDGGVLPVQIDGEGY